MFLPATFPDQEKIKLQSAVRNYTTFLYVGFVFGTLAPRAAVKAAPAAVASAQRFLAGGYDLTVTVVFFAAATLLLQARLARALRPSTNTKARLTPLAAWSLAVVTWCCITSVFHHCLTFGDENLGGRRRGLRREPRHVRTHRQGESRAIRSLLRLGLHRFSCVLLPLTLHNMVSFSYFQRHLA